MDDAMDLTLDGHSHPAPAEPIVEDAYDPAIDETQIGAAPPPRSAVLGFGDGSRRAHVDTQHQAAGEARITKDVVEYRRDIEVPVVHEELFVERRPVAETIDDAGPIGEGETIRIPLMREDVVVTKRPVVTGEVVVGKRRVTGF